MGDKGQTAIKVIIVIGVVAAGILTLFASGFRGSMQPRESERVRLQQHLNYSSFDQTRAMEDIKFMEQLGPRPSGSESLEELRNYILKTLHEYAIVTRVYPFPLDESATEISNAEGVNVVGIVEGTKPGIILIGVHYDTKLRTTINFTGANQSASGTAWLLEIARILGPRRDGRTVWLVWFDAHESINEAVTMPSLMGSEHFIEQMKQNGQLDLIQAMLYVGQIGDCYLNISKDEGAPEWMWNLFGETAFRLGYQRHFSQRRQGFLGDFKAFREADIPAMALVDFVYGGSILNHSKFWHTEEDTIDKLCGDSLRVVADIFMHTLPALDARLDDEYGDSL